MAEPDGGTFDPRLSRIMPPNAPPKGTTVFPQDAQKAISKQRSIKSVYSIAEVPFLEFKFRREAAYLAGSKKLYFSEQPWQREWVRATPWGEEAKSVGPRSKKETWPFPGKTYWTKKYGYRTYEEVNIGPDGYPLPRTEMSSEPGMVKDGSLTQMPRHP